jgi:hypothetical protein
VGSRCLVATIFIEVSHPQPILSPQGEKVMVSGFAGGLLALLALGFAVAGAPVAIAAVPVALVVALAAAVGRDLRHVVRFGWHIDPGGAGGPGRDPDDPRAPSPHGPSGDAADAEWDRFVSQFWEHVERERQLAGV